MLKINKFKMNKLIIFFIIFSFFSFSLLNIKTVRASATSLPVYKYDYKNVSDYETSSSNSFSSSMWYSSDGYSGNIYKNGASYVISGEAPKQVGTRVLDTKTIHHAVYEKSWAKIINGVVVNDGWEATPTNEYKSYFSKGYEQVSSGVEDWTAGTVDNTGKRYLAYYCWEWATLEKKEPIYSSDTRIWRQDYSGTISKGYLDYILDAEISCDLQEKMFTGKNYTFHVKAKNIGDKAWKAGDNITLNKVGGSFPLQNNKLELPNDKVIIPGDSYTWTIDIKAPSPGNYDIQFQMNQLGQGNFGNITKNNVKVYDSPTNGNLEVRKYDFKESDSVYWIKNKNEFQIYTEGYMNSIYGSYPEKNYIILAQDGKIEDSSPTQYSDLNGSYYKQKSTYDNFFDFKNKDKSNTFNNLDRNYLQSTHSLFTKKEADFKLFYNTSFFIDSEEIFSTIKDSGVWVKVDGTAPSGSVLPYIDTQTSDIKIDVRNVTDGLGSGVKRVYVKYYNSNKKIERDLSFKNGSYVDNIKVTDFFDDDVNIEVYAVDNVGNEAKLYNTIYNLFSVKANVVPYENKNYIGSKPVLKRGQKSLLKVTTTGYPTQLRITFPDDLLVQDGTLNKIIDIDPKKDLTTEYEFYIPINAEMKDYSVKVQAIKGTKIKDASPEFNVNDSITSGLHRRRKY